MIDEHSRGYYGWFVVGGLFVILTITSGLAFYNMSVYMSALVEAKGFPVSRVSAAIAAFFVASGLGGVVAGRLLTAFDPRLTLVLGGVLGAGSLYLVGRVDALWQLFVVYLFFGVGHACCALVPSTTLVTRWFQARRSVALSIASTGLSLGGILITPASATYIERVGLAAASELFALIWLIGVIPVALLVIRQPPAPPMAEGETSTAPDGWRYDHAVRSRWFLAITGGWVLVMLAQVGAISHLFNLASVRASPATAATVVSLMASASILGRFAGGWLITRIDARKFALACMVGQCMSLSALAGAQGDVGLWLASLAFGATVGNLLMLQPLLLAELFGGRDYSRIYGLSQLLSTLGVASGPALLGLLFDMNGRYLEAFGLAAGASAIALVAMLVAGPFPAAAPDES